MIGQLEDGNPEVRVFFVCGTDKALDPKAAVLVYAVIGLPEIPHVPTPTLPSTVSGDAKMDTLFLDPVAVLVKPFFLLPDFFIANDCHFILSFSRSSSSSFSFDCLLSRFFFSASRDNCCFECLAESLKTDVEDDG